VARYFMVHRLDATLRERKMQMEKYVVVGDSNFYTVLSVCHVTFTESIMLR